jgi:hypothetical protein
MFIFTIFILYFFIGFAILILTKELEQDFKHVNPEKYNKYFGFLPKYIKAFIRFTWFIFWPYLIFLVIIKIIYKFLRIFLNILID